MWERGSEPYQSCLCLLLIGNLNYQDNTKNEFDKKSQFETERSLHQLHRNIGSLPYKAPLISSIQCRHLKHSTTSDNLKICFFLFCTTNESLKISVIFILIYFCPVSDNLRIVLSLINFVFLFNGKKVVSSILLAIAMKFEIPIS